MSFGFSVGDFLTAGELIFKALREASGSAHQYRRVDLEVNSPKPALIEVDKLVPPPELEATVAAIKATARSCQLPLRELRVRKVMREVLVLDKLLELLKMLSERLGGLQRTKL